MGEVEFFGAVPEYGEFYYNLHAETGRCIRQLEERFSGAERDPALLISQEPILSRKVALAALKVRAAHSRSTRTNVIWLDAYSGTSAGALWEAVMAGLVEIWLQLDAVETSYFERKLVSSGTLQSEPVSGLPPLEIVKILDQMSGVEIVVVVDVRDGSAETADLLDSMIAGFVELLVRHSRNQLAMLLLATPQLIAHRQFRRLRRAGGVPIELSAEDLGELAKLLPSRTVRDSGYGQMAPRDAAISRDDGGGSAIGTSLALVGQPILASAVSYLASVADGGDEVIENLAEEGSVERLRNRGLALTNRGAARFADLRIKGDLDLSRRTLEANGAHLLSALRPRDLRPLEANRRTIDVALERSRSIVENVGACLAARVGRSTTLGTFLGDRLASILRSGNIEWSALEADLLEEVLKYLSVVAFREPALFDQPLFKLTEELTYAINGYGAEQDAAATQYERAQRITRLTHLYDRAPQEVRRRLGLIDTRRYARQALQILEVETALTDAAQEIIGTYLAGWLHHDIDDASRARNRIMEAARLSRLNAASAKPLEPPLLPDNSLTYDLAAQALFFSDEPVSASEGELVLELLQSHGIISSLAELMELARPDETSRKRLPKSPGPAGDRWHILFNRRDFGVAIMIASAILFEWHRPVELVCVGDTDDVGTALSRCGGRRVVIGGPDSPGPIGEYLESKVPEISRLWQLRFNESFYQPVVLGAEGGSPFTVLLLTSIAGDGLRAWRKFILLHKPFEREGQIMEPAFFGSLLPTILTTGSKKLTEIFIERVVKAVESKLDPQARAAAGKELVVVRSVLEQASESGSPQQAERRIEEAFKSALQSKLVLTGIIDATDDASLYAQLEDVVAGLAFVEGSTTQHRELAVLLRALGLAEERRATKDIERARRSRAFADGFTNLISRFDALTERYETKAEWDAGARNKVVNDLISTGTRFLAFARQDAAPG
jgi:hypothetical protein